MMPSIHVGAALTMTRDVARGVDSDAEDPPEHARPQNLVDKGADARTEKQQRERRREGVT